MCQGLTTLPYLHIIYMCILRPRDEKYKNSNMQTVQFKCVNINKPAYPEAEFSNEIKTKVLRVFLLAIHSHLYTF